MVETTDTRTPLALQRFDQRAEVAVAGEEHDVVDVRRHLHGVDGELDVHVALDLAAAGRVGELLGGLRHHGEAVVVQPVDQRADRRVFLGLEQRGVVEGAQQLAAAHELGAQELVVDVEAERAGGGVEIGAVDEESQPLVAVKHDWKPPADLSNGWTGTIKFPPVRGAYSAAPSASESPIAAGEAVPMHLIALGREPAVGRRADRGRRWRRRSRRWRPRGSR